MTEPSHSARPPRPTERTAPRTPLRWFADRLLRTKFAVLLGVVVLSFSVLAATTLTAHGAVRSAEDQLARQVDARALVLQLDTRASELKVDVFKTLVRDDAAGEYEELRDDIATPVALLEELAELSLDSASADAVAELTTSYGRYTDAITALVDAAVTDQAGQQAGWEQIQTTNDLIDAALGSALSSLDSADAAARSNLTAAIDRVDRLTVGLAVAAMVLLAGLCLVIQRSIARPLAAVRRSLEALARGDLTVRTGVDQRDELGRMAEALDAAQHDVRAVLVSVASSADAVAASSEELSASSAQISASAEETSAQADVVSGAAEEVSRNVQTVSAGAEQMGASIREISQNASQAARVAATAVAEAEATNALVKKLEESSREIGEVGELISSIAAQTNLLALNATIEAARAGEAGTGFAVVSTEVKELARETAEATENITRRVTAIQGDTADALDAIGRVGGIVASINDFQATIASAVEEQTATTAEMSRSVQQAAGGSSEIAANITGVSTAAGSTTQALAQTRVAVDDLARMAADLRSTVARFRY